MFVKTFILLALLLGVFGDYIASESVSNTDTDNGEVMYVGDPETFVSTPRYYGSTIKYGKYRTTRVSYYHGDDSTRRYRGSTRRYSGNYHETTMSPYTDSRNRYRHTTRRYENSYRTQKPYRRYVNFPYFDLTETLDSKNETEIKNALNLTTHIYYSTDSLISNIMNLSWVPKLINETLSKDQEEDTHFCLMISFRIVQNKSGIDWRYIRDVLIKPNNQSSEDSEDSLEYLRKHLCKVVLDFQVDHLSSEYYNSQDYLHDNRISFTKYAKKILPTVLGFEVSVGVIYTEQQVFDDFYLRYREIEQADFQIISITYTPLLRMPLTFDMFEKPFSIILEELRRQSLNTDRSRDRIKYDTSFMLVWNATKSIEDSSDIPDLQKAQMKVFKMSEIEYLNHFKFLAYFQAHFRDYRIGMISGLLFDMQNFEAFKVLKPQGKLLKEILPSLHVQETDVSPCQLREMLNWISVEFDYLVVDEYTWSTMVGHYDQLSDNQLMRKTCSKVSRLNLPTNVMLLASRGIGQYWNDTGKIFESLLSDNPNLGEMNIKTVVFSAEDIFMSYLKSDSTNYDVTKFVKSWKQANMSNVGCLVDVSRHANGGYTPDIVKLSKDRCTEIFDDSNVFIWEYKVDFMLTSAYNFTYEMDRGNLKMVLIEMLIAREMFLKNNPQKEVIFSINMGDHRRYSEEKEKREMQLILFNWARFNKVKLMFKPVYDLKNPENGYFKPPNKNGEVEDSSSSKY